jgi:uncharacterized protein with PQ loop repeat
MIEVIGYVGAFAFAISALPQTLKCYKEGHADGLSRYFLALWLIGEISMIAYTIATIGYINPLMLNYGFNLVLLLIIIRFKILPKYK